MRDPEIATVLDANFPADILEATIPNENHIFEGETGRVTVIAQAKSPTDFVSVFGLPTSTIHARSVVVDGECDMDVVLVLKDTGPM